MKKRSGFTLVEIMIVVAAIGILASLGTLALTKSIKNYRIKTAETEMEIIAAAVLQLAWDTGRWPNGDFRTETGGAVVRDLSLRRAGLLLENRLVFGDDWKGPYYDGNTVDPWGENYIFDPNHNGKPVIRTVNREATPVALQ